MTDRSPWSNRLAQRWYDQRTFCSSDLPGLRDLAARKHADGVTVSVVLPALNEAETIGGIVRCIADELMGPAGLVDELFVIDADSTDDTASVARAAGAEVVRMSDLLPQIDPQRGKGESLWRSLTAVRGDLVVWVDADIRNFGSHFVSRLVAPLLLDPDTAFVKGFYRRPIANGDELLPEGGGRVTELLARPLLSTFFPELGGLVQPLSGEYAGRVEILRGLPFFTGYSVEVGLLIDLLGTVGLDALAQVNLDERVHRNRPLSDLGPMAAAIGRTIIKRAEEWGRLKTNIDYTSLSLMLPSENGLTARDVRELERPPIAVLSDTLVALERSRMIALDGQADSATAAL